MRNTCILVFLAACTGDVRLGGQLDKEDAGATPIVEAGADAEGGPSPQCVGVDLQNDVAHCGFCNHRCAVGACSAGRCASVPFATAPNDVIELGPVAVDDIHVKAGGPKNVDAGVVLALLVWTKAGAVDGAAGFGSGTYIGLSADSIGIVSTFKEPPAGAVGQFRRGQFTPAFRYRTPGPQSAPAIDATFAVFTTQTELLSVRRDQLIPGGSPAPITTISGGFTDAAAVALDANRYFVADRGANAIVLFDGAKSSFATVPAPAHVALDATSVYWASTTAAGRIDKTSRAVETLKNDFTAIVAITADATQLYVADRAAIWARNAGTWRIVATTTDRIGGFALDTDRLYYTEATTKRVFVVSK